MSKQTFAKEVLLDMDLPYAAVEDRIVDKSRWSVIHEIIFKLDDKFYRTTYSTGATEYQEESHWEYDDKVECEEVHQAEKTVKVWEPV
jgi:hypothetical protein